MTYKSLVDTTKLVRALNKRGLGVFRSEPTGLGDVRAIDRRRLGRWMNVTYTDNLMGLHELVKQYLPTQTIDDFDEKC